MTALEAAGSAGIKVKELSEAIGTKAVNIHSWFHSTVKRNLRSRRSRADTTGWKVATRSPPSRPLHKQLQLSHRPAPARRPPSQRRAASAAAALANAAS
jgi:hypothetical protein